MTETHNQNGQVSSIDYGWMAGLRVTSVQQGPSLQAPSKGMVQTRGMQ
jgi:hypothetical protein